MTLILNGTDNSATVPAVQGGTAGTSTGLYYPTTSAVGISTAGTNAVYIDASQNVGIGTSSPGNKLSVVGDQRITLTTAGTSYPLILANNTASGVSAAAIAFQNGGSTKASIQAAVYGNDYMTFNVGSNTERMRIDSSGNVLVTSAAGLGYGTGSGGTVTQATSKGTTVTLNKPTGVITMNNAALGANTEVGFLVNNSLVSVIDSIIVVPANTGGVSMANYNVRAAASAGAVLIYVKNISGGSLSDALVINFAVIKGATS